MLIKVSPNQLGFTVFCCRPVFSLLVFRLAGRLWLAVPAGDEALQLPAAVSAAGTESKVPATRRGHQQPGVGVSLGERGGVAHSGAQLQQGLSQVVDTERAGCRLVAP